MDDFMQAVEWASGAVWGGIFSPILPLLSDDAALDALIARWNVDVLAPVLLSPSASSLEDEALDIRVGTVSATLVQAHAALLDQIAHKGLTLVCPSDAGQSASGTVPEWRPLACASSRMSSEASGRRAP
jgi:hypothetical protein